MSDNDVIEIRRVDNPHTSWAQFLFELENGRPDAGVMRAPVNLTTLLGGFARFRGTEAQKKAAARFKSLYERAQLGGSKAIDPSIEAVDGGKANPEAIFEIGADARRELVQLQAALGMRRYRIVEFVIMGDKGPTACARLCYRAVAKPNTAQIARVTADFRRLMDWLAHNWGFQT